MWEYQVRYPYIVRNMLLTMTTHVAMPELMNGGRLWRGRRFPRPLQPKPLVHEYGHASFCRTCQVPIKVCTIIRLYTLTQESLRLALGGEDRVGRNPCLRTELLSA